MHIKNIPLYIPLILVYHVSFLIRTQDFYMHEALGIKIGTYDSHHSQSRDQLPGQGKKIILTKPCLYIMQLFNIFKCIYFFRLTR
jgi:hypothetical protein